MRAIVLCIWTPRSPIKHVVSGEVNEPGVELTAGHREITDGETIGNEGGQRLIFRDVYLIVRGRIEHDGRIGVRQSVLNDLGVANIHLGAIEALHQVATLREDAHQLHPKLPTAPKNNHIASVH
jgi:hypothetical protein